MTSTAAIFERNFVSLPHSERQAYISQIIALNCKNAEITNLLTSIDIKSHPKDTAAKYRVDNIHFVCRKLRAFSDFTLE